ncbi:cytochrome o ubiquinol oxidase subunit IV [compost metagenome]
MILTLIPFGLVMYPTLPKDMTVLIVVAFAVIQIVVHLYYFLHLDRSPEQR